MCMNLGASKVQWKCRGAQAFGLRLQSLSAMGIAAVGQGFTGLGVVFGPQSGGGILALRLSPVLLTFLVRGNVIFLHPPPTRPVKFWPVGCGQTCCVLFWGWNFLADGRCSSSARHKLHDCRTLVEMGFRQPRSLSNVSEQSLPANLRQACGSLLF